MPTRDSSLNSAGAVYLDKHQRIEEVRAALGRARARVPAIRRAILFGSLASGTPTPRSDADILIVVTTSEHPHARSRVPAMLAALSPLPCPVDLSVLTADEFERARGDDDPLVREALASGIDL